MKFVKIALLVISVVAAGLALSLGILRFGGQGYFTLALCGVVAGLAVFGIVTRSFPRWASGVSGLALFILAMKTTKPPFDNIMMLATLGLMFAIAGMIKPERPPAS